MLQCSADGEFARIKAKYGIHLTRREYNETYLEIKDSTSFRQFGEENVRNMGPKSQLETRLFYHLDNAVIQE